MQHRGLVFSARAAGRRFHGFGLSVVLIAALCSGCAIPTESEPRELGAGELPKGLVPTSVVTTTEAFGSDVVGVWYQTQSGGLRRVERNVDEASVRNAIEALFEPIAEETPNRLINQWNDPDIELIGLDLRGGDRLTVNLTAIPPAAEGALADPTFAQMVWTATQSPFGVDRVRLQVEGEPIRMVAGERGAGFISRSDFANQPEGVPVTTTTQSQPRQTTPTPQPQPSTPGTNPGS